MAMNLRAKAAWLMKCRPTANYFCDADGCLQEAESRIAFPGRATNIPRLVPLPRASPLAQEDYGTSCLSGAGLGTHLAG